MKHNVGDLVAMEDVRNWMNPVFHLGYIVSIHQHPHGCMIYFFDTESTIWYSEKYVDAFKENLNHLDKYDGKREIDWKPGKRNKNG
jgi:hypothetical protein